MSKHVELAPGTVFGNRTIIKRVENINRNKVMYECQCKCGEISCVEYGLLIRGRSKSCHSCSDERGLFKAKHGMSTSPEYRAWKGAISRCYYKKSISYKNYGGRGIKVCDEWLGEHGFENFYKSLGPRPSRYHSLDRIDVMGDYTPENTKWATTKEQNFNKRKIGDLKYFKDYELIIEIRKRKLINLPYVVGLLSVPF
jgi:hypothetical protein